MNTIKILFSLCVLGVVVGCNSDEEFINPFLTDDGFASRAAFVRFEKTPDVVANREIPIAQVSGLTITGELVDPAGNVQNYDLRVARNPSLGQSLDTYAPLLTINNFQEDVPVPVSITINDIVGALGIQASDLAVGDVLDFEAIVTREDGVSFDFNNLTGDVFNQGERQAISFSIEITE